MVSMVVGDHDQIDGTDAVAAQGGVEDHRVGPTVDENDRVRRMADQDGVALTDVEEHHRGLGEGRRRQTPGDEPGGETGGEQRTEPAGDGHGETGAGDGDHTGAIELGPAGCRRRHPEHSPSRHRTEVQQRRETGHGAGTAEHRRQSHQRGGEQVGQRGEQRDRAEVGEGDGEHGELSPAAHRQGRPQPAGPSSWGEPHGGQHPTGSGHRQLEPDLHGEVGGEEQETDDGDPQRSPRIDRQPDQASPEHHRRHRRRTDDRRLPPGGDDEHPEGDDAEGCPKPRIDPEGTDHQPPRRQEDGDVAARHRHEVRQTGLAQLVEANRAQLVGVADEETGQQGGRIRLRALEPVEHQPPKTVPRAEERAEAVDRISTASTSTTARKSSPR